MRPLYEIHDAHHERNMNVKQLFSMRNCRSLQMVVQWFQAASSLTERTFKRATQVPGLALGLHCPSCCEHHVLRAGRVIEG